jgi:hypothetical protein
MLSPLDVDRHSATRSPVGVQDRSMPIGPDVRWRLRRVVSNPDDFFVSRFRERYPRTNGVVTPEKVVTDYWTVWMYYRDDTLELEPFIALKVQHRRESMSDMSGRIIPRKYRGNVQRTRRDVCSWPASSE